MVMKKHIKKSKEMQLTNILLIHLKFLIMV